MNYFVISMLVLAAFTTIAPNATAECSQEDPTGTGIVVLVSCNEDFGACQQESTGAEIQSTHYRIEHASCGIQSGTCEMDSNGNDIQITYYGIEAGVLVVRLIHTEGCFAAENHDPSQGGHFHFVMRDALTLVCAEAQTGHIACVGALSHSFEDAHSGTEQECRAWVVMYDEDQDATYQAVELPDEACPVLLDPEGYAEEQIPV